MQTDKKRERLNEVKTVTKRVRKTVKDKEKEREKSANIV